MSESGEPAALIKLQQNRLKALSKTLINFKKDAVGRKNAVYFQERLKRVDELNREFYATHNDIVRSDIDPEDDYLKNDIASQFEEAHLDVVCALTQQRNELHPPKPELVEPSRSNNESVIHAHCTSAIQFPRLPVPKFSGKITEWPSFHNSFNRLIHANSELNDIQKFHYLKQALPVDHDTDIHQMLLTEVNYKIAWEFLLKRYNNPRILFSHHMTTLYNLPVLARETSDALKAMLNAANACIIEFNRLKLPITQCDHWIAHYLTTKLPSETHRAWERHLGCKTDIPTFSELQEFLTTRLFTIDAIENRNMAFDNSSSRNIARGTKNLTNSSSHYPKYAIPAQRVKSLHASAKVDLSREQACILCSQAHILRRCPTFLSKDCYERKDIVDKAKLCLNCLSVSHALSRCTSSKNCFQCGQRHHTLLHFPLASQSFNTHTPKQLKSNHSPAIAQGPHTHPRANTLSPSADVFDPKVVTNAHAKVAIHSTQFDQVLVERSATPVLLATALVSLRNEANDQSTLVYALIDQGSEGTLISETAVQRLGLQRSPTSADICGVGPNISSHSKARVSCILQSCHDEHFTAPILNAYVLKNLTTQLPSQPIVPPSLTHLQGLRLADPMYYQPKKIDLIIGADMIAQILLPETRIGDMDQPIAQHTHLGWILSGRIASTPSPRVTVRCHHSNIELESLVHKFYESEQVPAEPILSEQDKWCEGFFRTTHTRQADGKYLVRLPLKSLYDPNITLGKSKQIALNRFYKLERRLQQDPDLRDKYTDGIEDYFRLNQITLATTSEDQHCKMNAANKPTVTSCVLPHHAVVKSDSLMTKVRIVYDASAKTSNGRSLNDLLCTGPSLQNDLPSVILKWRLHTYVFIADVQKMYRCINVHKDDTEYQRILWRNTEGNVQEYCLTTVTFGTASAPYTAIRVIHQLAHDEKGNFPLAEKVLLHDIYVDDILSGSDSINEATRIRDQLISALRSAGMELRKWSSNTPELLESIPREHQSCNPVPQLNENETVKTLGLHWHPAMDSFTFSINFSIDVTATKRSVLSTIARLFDPLGFLTPVTVAAKIILKEIWATRVKRQEGHMSSLEWDEELPSSLKTIWMKFVTELPLVKSITIPRWVQYSRQHVRSVELHAFSDGSSVAYAAAVYARIEYNHNEIHTHLLAAKSKVTPTSPITIPRVELCGAVLATNLASWVQETVSSVCGIVPIYYWTDATVILYWIKGDINRWKPYIANRIGKILAVSATSQWNHVSTFDNPADCATRGLTPLQLKAFNIWWNGPSWLRQSKSTWPNPTISELHIDAITTEEKPVKVNVNSTVSQQSFIQRFSSFSRLIRITAWILRATHNMRPENIQNRRAGSLTAMELQESLFRIVRCVQHEAFGSDMHRIQAGHALPTSSKLVSLTPFVDDNMDLRIRGRLKHAALPYGQRHPLILPSNHHFTTLVINNAHNNTLHGGVQLTLANIRQRFWIINARKTVRNQLRRCIRCFRNKPQAATQLMGDLPTQRVNPPQRAFLATGVDYTGAIELKASRYRGTTVYKGYIALFICMATKAVHLEAVTGMTTEHFLWALQRFIGRRGLCRDLYSDCGTNFVGSDTLLKTTSRQFIENVERDIVPKLAAQNIQWHFNPPHSPNFGGLWEANVKSVKHHLKRIVGAAKLTYEQLSTVLVRIEACLNSRPLCPLTSDPDDLFVLTPGHFLIGDALLSVPEVAPNNKTLSAQYFELERMVQHFWNRWSSDWLSHLQSRPKWRHEEPNLCINELVVVKDDRLPPNQWQLGRVLETHPGSDNLVRVVTVRTQNGTYKRSISKICRLPIPFNNDSPQLM